MGFPCNVILGSALGIRTIADHCSSMNDLIQSTEGMMKKPSQYSLADLQINLRFSIPCLWNSDLKEDRLMNILAVCLKQYNLCKSTILQLKEKKNIA